MTDLTEFLLARIAEDQSAAENRAPGASIHEVGCYYYNFTRSPRVWIEACCDCTDETRARALAECEAKRAIVGEHRADIGGENGRINWGRCRTCVEFHADMDCEQQEHPCVTLRLLALPYADHVDFDPAWAQ